MSDLVVTALLPAVLIGLNHLARNPRAEGRGWRASGKMTGFGVRAAGIGFAVLMTLYFMDMWFPNLGNLGDSLEKLVALFALFWLTLYGAGVLSILVSLFLRLWLRFDAYFRKVGPENFAQNVGHLGWTVGKSGLKLYGMVFAALAAFHLLGLRNLLFLRALRDGPLFDEPSEPARKDSERTYGAPPAA